MKLNVVLPFALIALMTILFRWVDLDLRIEHFFYTPEAGWWLSENCFVQLLYQYGTWPTVAAAIGGLLMLGISLRHPPFRAFRRSAVYALLVLIIGPGLIVNSVFKSHFGRPRPNQTVDLGGTQPFHAVLEPGESNQHRSFPSGHASMGFYWFSFFFICRRHGGKLCGLFLLLALLHGGLMGFARMAQGAHFPSDILWSGAFVYFTALGLDALISCSGAPRRVPPTT